MRQRVMIAIALACRPKLLIADEATTALDVTTQAQIMELLLELQAELGMALMLISHDLGLAGSYADEVWPGETLGVVGETGSGKSTLARSILQAPRPTSGEVVFRGADLVTLHGARLLQARRH